MVNHVSSVSIRLATCPDAEAIGTVQLATWNTTYRGIGIDPFLDQTTVENRVARWGIILCNPNNETFVYVAEVDQQIVGFAMGGRERSADPDYHGELYAIYLLQAYQRRGIGQTLVQTVKDHLHESGFNSMLLWVLAVNSSARLFYEACGGQSVRQRDIEFGGKMFDEIGYGWLI